MRVAPITHEAAMRFSNPRPHLHVLWQVVIGLAVLTPLPATAGPSCTPAADGRIVGDVVRSVGFRTREPLAGVPISLNTGATVVSDAAGRFEFRGLAPGSYLLRAELPNELMALASENPIELQPHACAGVSVRAVPNTMVRGRVILPKSFRAEGLTVSLMTPDGVLVENAYADSQGTFVIAGQPPGEYVVGVNTSGMPPTPDNPFPPTFAPGTSDIQQADRIRLEVPTDLTDVNIFVPRASPIATITVAAKDVLGRPVEAAQLVTSLGGGDVRLGQTDSRGVAQVRMVGGVRQYLMVSGLGGCASPVAIGPADLPATLEVTLHREGCREAHDLRRPRP